MSHFDAVLLLLRVFTQRVDTLAAHALLVLGANPITIDQFFSNLYGKLTAFALALSTFFFAWAAILYGASGTGNERAKQHAQAALYAALVGLALALLAGVVSGLINAAATGK
ncbi:MAG TPA: hypothetical protein VFV38_12490 [Ktedonobacteraceae bacterium]|nr:hypothetical protein [Ktedonobacteraceae bacterium]